MPLISWCVHTLQVDIPSTIKEIVGESREAEFLASLDKLSEDAFDDQCTGANPRYPLISDLKQIYIDAWSAPIVPLNNLEFPMKK